MNRIDILKAARLRRDARCRIVGREIVVLEQTASTNDVVREMSTGDWPEGLVVFAEHQTAGRGQRGNKWESSAGKGLWFSVLLQPQLSIEQSAQLTAWAAKVIAATVESHCRLKPWIKEPNDVYIGERKIAGVLVEMCARAGAPHIAVVGIGLNVNQTVTDFSEGLRQRASSLAMFHRRRLNRHQLAVELLQNLDRAYAAFRGW